MYALARTLQFDEQIKYQGVERTDFFIAETIEYLGEAKLALQAIKVAGQVAMITLGFKYKDKTLHRFPSRFASGGSRGSTLGTL